MDAALAMHRALMTQAKTGPISHVFSGRYALTLRGCTQPTRWIDVEVSLPEMNGLSALMKIFDAEGSEFSCATYGFPFCMVCHAPTGIYFRLSIK
jgi:hypothetical protein